MVCWKQDWQKSLSGWPEKPTSSLVLISLGWELKLTPSRRATAGSEGNESARRLSAGQGQAGRLSV